MIKRNSKAAAVGISGLGIVLLTSGTAYGFWTAAGSGTGSASATTAQTISAAPATVATGLYPGATGSSAVQGSVTIINSNPFPVKVTAATFAPPSASNGTGTCTTTGVALTAQSLSTPVTVPPRTGGTNGTATLTFTATMDNTSQDGCQGATFTSAVTLTGQS